MLEEPVNNSVTGSKGETLLTIYLQFGRFVAARLDGLPMPSQTKYEG